MGSRVQFDVRFKAKGKLPPSFNAEAMAEDLFKFMHGTLLPKYGIEAEDSVESNKFKYHKHESTDYDACSGCITTAQDGEN